MFPIIRRPSTLSVQVFEVIFRLEAEGISVQHTLRPIFSKHVIAAHVDMKKCPSSKLWFIADQASHYFVIALWDMALLKDTVRNQANGALPPMNGLVVLEDCKNWADVARCIIFLDW